KGLFGRVRGQVRAVDDVSFEVLRGETLGLVGESGCGKTTLGRTILRLIEPTSGDIRFNGTRINGLNNRLMRLLRRDMQIIFQDPYSSLNPRLPVGTAIAEPMTVHHLYGNEKIRKEKAMELLHRVNLDSTYFQRYPHELSGGQRQRICIARALAVEPRFIICDESVSALDVSIQAQILNLLNDLKEEYKMTYIFISHDLAVVKFMSDRMMVMKSGKIEEMGPAEDIYRNPGSEYTRKLIEAIPVG
ncbi:MAG: ATP-binding cassette domain-containing protein, partial [Bacteroidota bacterium]|nr:ATP-binding cassette domain-containing protein [Bacteroidota bacterium]